MNKAYIAMTIVVAATILFLLGMPTLKNFSELDSAQSTYSFTMTLYQVNGESRTKANHHPLQFITLDREYKTEKIENIVLQSPFEFENIRMDQTIAVMPDHASGTTNYTYAIHTNHPKISMTAKLRDDDKAVHFFEVSKENVAQTVPFIAQSIYEFDNDEKSGEYAVRFRRSGQNFDDDQGVTQMAVPRAIGFSSDHSAIILIRYDEASSQLMVSYHFGSAITDGQSPALKELRTLGTLPENLSHETPSK